VVENHAHGRNKFPRYGDMIASSETNPLSVSEHLFNQYATSIYPAKDHKTGVVLCSLNRCYAYHVTIPRVTP
jgi:hypothetical protein